jgi:chemotaxis protein CheD
MQTRSVPGIYLRPGEYYFGRRPAYIHTVLGSCVAVSIYHRHTGLAAICHAVQPDFDPAEIGNKRDIQPSRFVQWVVPAMIRAFLTRRANPAELEIKLFGGASLIGDPLQGGNRNSVGALNISAAKQIITENGLVLTAADVGGHSGRKIIFNTHTGVVLMRRM